LNIPCLLVFFRATEGSTNKDDWSGYVQLNTSLIVFFFTIPYMLIFKETWTIHSLPTLSHVPII
jgi:hypothetical protein